MAAARGALVKKTTLQCSARKREKLRDAVVSGYDASPNTHRGGTRRDGLSPRSAWSRGHSYHSAALPQLGAAGADRIGVLNDQSGLYRDFGGPTSVLAARMAAEDFGGNVFGRPIEVIDADHQNKADLASAIARGWFDRQGVAAIADLTNSAVALAVQQLARERGKITLLTGPATTKLTNEECSPTGFHWVFDTYSQATGTAKAMLAEGGKTWFLLVADYSFGHQMAHDLRTVVSAGGGQVVGEALHPLSTPDFASFLLQAQASKAQVIGLANGGDDTTNAIKQAAEFGITRRGQKLAGLVIVISIVHGLGLEIARGLEPVALKSWHRFSFSRSLSDWHCFSRALILAPFLFSVALFLST